MNFKVERVLILCASRLLFSFYSITEAQFKGIFVRYLAALTDVIGPSHPSFSTFSSWLQAQADSVWNRAQSSEGTFGLVWRGPASAQIGPTPVTHTSGVDALVAAAQVCQTQFVGERDAVALE
jgi:predicted alpha-1,6-mannanase (GH76 family)